jgi:enoyl-CoA hydratase
MGPSDALLVERPAEGVLLLTLKRPDRRNVLATPLLDQVAAALTRAEQDSDVGAVIVTGGARIFAAGADLDELAAASAQDPVESSGFRAWADIRSFPNRSWLPSKAGAWARGRN